MRWMMRGLILAAVAAGVGGLSIALPTTACAQLASPAPASRPADAKAAVPVRAVVLYSSGVGYFQHSGTVDGNATTELRFKSGQINDVLKSLILEDKGGTVSAVTYPSQDPLAKTLRSFQVDITSNPSLDQLLNQLRGAKVTAVLPTEKVTGTILGVEKRTKPAGENKTIEVPVLNLISGASIRSIELTEIRDIELEDATLQDELARALAALSAARDQDKKPVSIHFKGQGQRDVLLGYVVETPVWKTSYRLVLTDEKKPGDAASTQPATQPDAKAADASATAHLQGWAIVENQTDNDWDNVQLSLVSGRPISFVEDLYQPLYIPRPVVKPELYASLNPQTYEGAMHESERKRKEDRDAAGGDVPAAGAAPRALAMQESLRGEKSAQEMDQAAEAMDAVKSVASAASAANIGELFEYTIGSVTLPRQTSAMIPIVADTVGLQKLSIFNNAVLAKHPLNGARLKNTSGKHLLQGPITVLEGSHYAGDAQISDLPPGQERLISYGIDLQMLVDVKGQNRTDELVTGKIVGGVLELTHKYIVTTDYLSENKADHDKTLVIEHAILAGYNLVDTVAPIEKTDVLYRFQDSIKAGHQGKLSVKEQMVQDQGFALLSTDINNVIELSHGGPIPKDVKDALLKVADLKRAVTDTDSKVQQNVAREAEIVQDQKRINESLHTINQSTALYNRLLGKLNDQEDELEHLRKDRAALQKQKNDQQTQLEDFLATLNVG